VDPSRPRTGQGSLARAVCRSARGLLASGVSNTVTILPFEIPAAGQAVAVAPGVFWVRMPLPFALDHINLWLLDDGDGWTMVDTGVLSDDTKHHWERILDAHLGGARLNRLVCTHSHPDHMGLAGWVAETLGAELWTTQGEWSQGRRYSLERIDTDRYRAYYQRAGCTDADVAGAFGGSSGGGMRHFATVPETYHRLHDGDTIGMAGHNWSVMTAFGHSIEHACLFSETLNVMIGGDQFLPKITPALVVPIDEPNASPLRQFLDSNRRFLDLPEGLHVLPSHNLPFEGLQARIGQYESHHAKRLEWTLAACEQPASCIDIARRIFTRPIDGRSMFFAVGETLSHLRYLQDDGLICEAPDVNGVKMYSRI
jgi:glyoxylase-like metal-dependent hydrolase (beta-lactamase superfamily II)